MLDLCASVGARAVDVTWTTSEGQPRRSADGNQRSTRSPGLERVARLGAELCFIDTAPNRGDENANLLRRADLVLVPVRVKS
jgi:cellulose biosynthesis protein BcsQ